MLARFWSPTSHCYGFTILDVCSRMYLFDFRQVGETSWSFAFDLMGNYSPKNVPTPGLLVSSESFLLMKWSRRCTSLEKLEFRSLEPWEEALSFQDPYLDSFFHREKLVFHSIWPSALTSQHFNILSLRASKAAFPRKHWAWLTEHADW